MITDISETYILVFIVLLAFALLWFGKIKRISEILGLLVVLMALLFAFLAWQSGFSAERIVAAVVLPEIPAGSSLLIVGLIGTTIVPYNLFLGSGLSRKKELRSTRSGLIIAILMGGMITIFIVLAGSMVQGTFSFEHVQETILLKVGSWGMVIFAVGLFSAGFTSSVTAPLAAAVTVKSGINIQQHSEKNIFRLTWGVVLLTGAVISLLNYSPVAIIIAAQVINGLILPFLGVSIFLILNDHFLIPPGYRNGPVYNILMLVVVAVTIFLGIYHIADIIMAEQGDNTILSWRNPLLVSTILALLSVISLACKVFFGKLAG